MHLLHGDSRFSQAELAGIRTFLVLQYESPLGSVVHATPLFEALKHAVPDCYITVAASSFAASVLHSNPHIDHCLVTPSPFKDFSRSVRAVRDLLDSTPPGGICVITTIGNQRTRLAILSLLAGSAVRIGYTLAPELYDVPLTFDPERGQIEGNLDIVRSLGHPVPVCEPRVFFAQHDAEKASQWLESLKVDVDVPRIVFVTQNSGGQKNQWNQARFQQVIGNLSRVTGAVPIFVGTEKDAIPIDALRNELSEKGISLAGKTTIAELAALLAQCDLIVSLDTGTFHVARAVGLPGVVIAPAWQSPLEWLPVQSERYRVLRGPSIQDIPPDYSIDEISVEQVCEAAQTLLAKYPVDPAQRTSRVDQSLC
ncbi:MAG TPA: glycosyltransferase family 9 protein [Acidobacteriaceae bacterium]|nr:glycosyltransferase family 9 protein [Acidobacteriaceae bacterium]